MKRNENGDDAFILVIKKAKEDHRQTHCPDPPELVDTAQFISELENKLVSIIPYNKIPLLVIENEKLMPIQCSGITWWDEVRKWAEHAVKNKDYEILYDDHLVFSIRSIEDAWEEAHPKIPMHIYDEGSLCAEFNIVNI